MERSMIGISERNKKYTCEDDLTWDGGQRKSFFMLKNPSNPVNGYWKNGNLVNAKIKKLWR
jgi:hypothetical protein